MWSWEEIDEYLKQNLTENRYKHTMGVVFTAELLAEKNGESKERAKIAALVHDCAKNMKIDEQFEFLKSRNIELDEITVNSPQILHGIVGSIIAREVMGIKDEEILSAVKHHTTGKKSMTLLEKIIYIADYIEPNRNYNGVEELRQLTFDNLDEGALKGFDNTITYVIKLGQIVHPLSIDARNDLLIKIKNQKNRLG
jgi:predicted HD superfamily hydrolase involved in NAD metabolism